MALSTPPAACRSHAPDWTPARTRRGGSHTQVHSSMQKVESSGLFSRLIQNPRSDEGFVVSKSRPPEQSAQLYDTAVQHLPSIACLPACRCASLAARRIEGSDRRTVLLPSARQGERVACAASRVLNLWQRSAGEDSRLSSIPMAFAWRSFGDRGPPASTGLVLPQRSRAFREVAAPPAAERSPSLSGAPRRRAYPRSGRRRARPRRWGPRNQPRGPR
jgi:hypothetical protein